MVCFLKRLLCSQVINLYKNQEEKLSSIVGFFSLHIPNYKCKTNCMPDLYLHVFEMLECVEGTRRPFIIYTIVVFSYA